MPGDRLRLSCAQDAAFCVDRVIAADGSIVLPGVGPVPVGGRTLGDAEAHLSRAAARVTPGTRIAIRLLPPKSRPIAFRGAVKISGETPYRDGLRLGDILELAQPTTAADMSAITIESATGEVIVVDWLAPTGDTIRNTELRSGDIVTFPLRNGPADVLVLGGVERPGSFPYVPGLNLRRAISLAGGLSPRGRAEGVTVERDGRSLGAYNIEKGEDVELRAGDAVKVPLRADAAYITVQGAVRSAGVFGFRPGMKLTDAIAAAGGLAPFGDPTRIEIRTLSTKKSVRADLAAILRRTKPDVVLKPNDAVIVPIRPVGG